MAILENHEWPDDDKHLWGGWMAKNRNTVHRMCQHPNCTGIQEKPAPKA